MPQNKNHHFVPRTYLKRFANPTNQKAVALYNFKSNTHVAAAPLRGQCAKSYLYGEDSKLERLLGGLEGDYATASAAVIKNPMETISSERIEHLRLFLVLQMFRTEQAIEKTRNQLQTMHNLMFHNIEEAPEPDDMSDKKLVMSNIRLALSFYKHLTDLKFVVLRNQSIMPFLTSDAPAVATNRLFLQRYRSDNFGLGQSGVMLYLPVSPDTAIMFYDRDVYAPKNTSNDPIVIRKLKDVQTLNRLVVLEARENIYFRGKGDFIIQFISETRSNYTPRWHSGAAYVPQIGDKTTYERVADHHRQKGSMLYVSSVHYRNPRDWFPQLGFRNRMVGYTNGSAVGYVRRQTAAMDGEKVWKVDLNQAAPPPGPARDPTRQWSEKTG